MSAKDKFNREMTKIAKSEGVEVLSIRPSGKHQKMTIRTKDGRERWVSMSATCSDLHGARHLHRHLIRDIVKGLK